MKRIQRIPTTVRLLKRKAVKEENFEEVYFSFRVLLLGWEKFKWWMNMLPSNSGVTDRSVNNVVRVDRSMPITTKLCRRGHVTFVRSHKFIRFRLDLNTVIGIGHFNCRWRASGRVFCRDYARLFMSGSISGWWWSSLTKIQLSHCNNATSSVAFA